jgi:adenosylhomocysteine nucleosidase
VRAGTAPFGCGTDGRGLETPSILAVAAEAREFAGLLKHASGVAGLSWPLSFACKAVIGGQPWVLVANGPGATLAHEAAWTGCGMTAVRAVVSTGYCGGLDPKLLVGDIFAATEVRIHSKASSFAAMPVQAPHSGPLLSVDRVAVTRREKAALNSSGAAAVEMEAGAVAAVAGSMGLPFYCVRVVSDTAGEELPLDFNRYRDLAGRFSRAGIALAAVTRPWLIPGLIRFDRNSRRASLTLGDFLADCRF